MPQDTTGNNFEMDMYNGCKVQVFHVDALSMANIIPRTNYGICFALFFDVIYVSFGSI